MGLISKARNIIEWCEWFVPYIKCDKKEKLSLEDAKTEPIHVLMNGPTLKNSIHLIDKFPGKVLMVNDSISHLEAFENVKPDYYCLADPAYIQPTISQADLVANTWKDLNHVENTLELFVPNLWKNKFFIENHNIHIRYVVSVPAPSGKHIYKKLKKNTGAPAFQGVVIMGLYVALQLGYKKIYLHGAEHKRDTLYVNGNNDIYMKYMHKYDEEIVEENLKKNIGYNMLDESWAGVNLFKNLYLLRDYSILCGAEIINVSTDSMIDCFERYYKDMV